MRFILTPRRRVRIFLTEIELVFVRNLFNYFVDTRTQFIK